MKTLIAFIVCVCLVNAVPRPPVLDLPPRETIKFDFGWRFHLGDPAGKRFERCSDTDFPTNYSSVECRGLRHVAQATNADDCMDACCSDNMCQIW